MRILVAIAVVAGAASAEAAQACDRTADIVIWGGTVCGVTAAVAAVNVSRPGVKVVWLVNGTRLGGVTSGGLGGRDGGSKLLGPGSPAADIWSGLGQNFEPHAAEAAVAALLARAGSAVQTVTRTGWIAQVGTTGTLPRTITSITTLDGSTTCGRVFIDCSYEGDLLRLSGTSFAVGRESREQYNESMAGQDGPDFDAFAEKPSVFAASVSPFVEAPGEIGMAGVLLPGIVGVFDEVAGAADDWVMSMCFRMCLTNNKSNAAPIMAPEGYSVAKLELLRREIAAATAAGIVLGMSHLFLIRELPNSKIDLNSGQWSTAPGPGGYFPFSTDLPFPQHGWPTGTPAQRAEVFAEHVWWTRAILFYLGTDAALNKTQPALVTEVASYGLARDEYPDSLDHWTPQLYVRESARMVGARVVTQADICVAEHNPSSVGLSQWAVDVHAVKRVAAKVNGTWRVVNAGGRDSGRTHQGCGQMLEVPYEALTPRRNDTANLLVPVCASFSHVAFATFRLEPQYAIFGVAAGAAAAAAVASTASTLPVQEIDVTALQTTLSQRLGQWLWAQHPPGPPGPPAPPPGRETYGCALGRCIGVGARGKFSDKHCTATVTTTTTAAHTAAARGDDAGKGPMGGTCTALGPDEWLAHDCCRLWAVTNGTAGSPTVLTARVDTWLKKSTADSAGLPESEKLHVAAGGQCAAVTPEVYEEYVVCVPK